METSKTPAWCLPPSDVDLDVLKPSTEQQHLFDDFERFEVSATHGGFNIQVLVQVHKSICNGEFKDTCYVVCAWMGGGLFTCGRFCEAWLPSYFADILFPAMIWLFPTYPLLPGCSGEQQAAYARAFTSWIQIPDLSGRIKTRFSAITAVINTGHIDLLTADSAGAHMGVKSIMAPGSCTVDTFYPRFPMNENYEMDPANKIIFMNKELDVGWAREHVIAMFVEIVEGGPQERMGSSRLYGMIASALFSRFYTRVKEIDGEPRQASLHTLFKQALSVNDELRAMAKIAGKKKSERHLLRYFIEPLELAAKLLDKAKLASFGFKLLRESNAFAFTKPLSVSIKPQKFARRTILLHGDDDKNCSIQDSKEFQKLINILFPGSVVDLYEAEGEGHGFDYNKRDGLIPEVVRALQGLRSSETQCC